MSEDLKNRTCATCACTFRIEPPRVMTVGRSPPPAGGASMVLICRLRPPATLLTDKGPMIAQQQTQPYMSCWDWKPPGTLPGDVWAVPGPHDPDPHKVAPR